MNTKQNDETHAVEACPPLSEGLGSAVLVGGCLVAWFADPEQAMEWARENHWGNWLTWRAKTPEIVPLTSEELADCERRANEISEMLRIE